MSCSAKKDPNAHGGYNTVGRIGQEQKRSRRKEDSKQRKKQKNGMRISYYSNHLIRQ